MLCCFSCVRNASANAISPACSQATEQVSRLIAANLHLVYRIAHYVRRQGGAAIEPADLVQTGMVALVEAAQRYTDRGFGFPTYAVMRIRGAMIDHLRAQSPEPRSAILFRKTEEQARQRLHAALGRPPSDHEMATALDMPADLYRRRLGEAVPVRLESLADAYLDTLAAFALDEVSAEEQLCIAESAARLGDALARLSERETQVLHLYFTEERSLAEIGTALGVGAARVCQIKKGALERLRAMLAPLGDTA